MKVRAEYPPVVSRSLLWLRLAMAAVFVAMALGQLFAFEKFPGLLAQQLSSEFEDFSQLLAALIVIFEISAAAALLVVRLSPLARWAGTIAALLTPVVWYAIVFSGMSKIVPVNSGVLGTKIEIQASFWLLVLLVALFGIMVVVTRDSWRLSDISNPTRRSSRPIQKTSSK